MAGPVWRFDQDAAGTCGVCFRTVTEMYVEGEIAGNEMQTARSVCFGCYQRATRMVVRGELGGPVVAPGYARR